MRFEFSDEQRQLQRSLRDLLAREYSVQRAWTGTPTEIWPRLAQLGILGITVPEKSGGLGGSALDWILLMEEAGRAALAEPLADAFAAASLLSPEWASQLIEGRARVVVAGERSADADLYILRRENQLHAVPRSAVTLRRMASIDGARTLHRLESTPSATTRIEGEWPFDAMALAAAAELIGLGQHLLEVTVEYVKIRHQFGQPVGSFQAVKHHLANSLLELELARPFVYRAAYQPSSLHISMAKAAASDAAQKIARAALQCHGAIGYSFEHDLHFWMKRVWVLAAAWGSAAWHRERVARRILDGKENDDDYSLPR